MKVYYDSATKSCELLPGVPLRILPFKSSLELVKEKNDGECEVLLNGSSVDQNMDRFTCNADTELIVRVAGTTLVYSVRSLLRPITQQNAKAYEQFAYEYANKSFNELESIQLGELRLYAVDSSTEVNDWSELFDEIENTLQSLKQICEQPKSHLKAVNEVRPIETVKRIGYESIPYLASHSEDWLARTASGLKPARLFSRVEDDEFQIYENRVVKTLIDMVISFLRKTEKQLRDQRDQLRGIINSSVQTGSFGFDVSFQKAVHELISNDSDKDEHRTKSLEIVEKLQRRAYVLLKKYRMLRQSRLYRYLKKARPVTNPLNETNILLMDKHYSKVFVLWKSMHRAILPKVVDEEKSVAFADTCRAYSNYCRTLCGYAAHVLCFDILDDGLYFRETDNLEISIQDDRGLVRVNVRDRERISTTVPSDIKLPIAASEEYKKFSYDGKRLSWVNDITDDEIDEFCSLFKTRESRGKEQSEEKHRYSTLKQFLFKQKSQQRGVQNSGFVIIPAAIELDSESKLSLATAISELEVGDTQIVLALPLCEEYEQKATRYSKGIEDEPLILPLTMFDINSFRRLQNLLLRHIIGFGKDVCPSCGNTMRTVGDQKICDSCNQQIFTRTMCPACRHEYHYLSYNISDNTIEKMLEAEEQSFFQRDSLFQYKDVVEMSVASGKLRTICPKCHR